MGKDTIIDQLKSPLIRNELIKTIKEIDTKSIALTLHKLLDSQLTDKDVFTVKLEIVKKMEELKSELIVGNP
uniref:Uncharacterized protein n=1 Tax=viral metagenome TaxID=1070528 RepID=A0A6H2A6I8_9ZZZZ